MRQHKVVCGAMEGEVCLAKKGRNRRGGREIERERRSTEMRTQPYMLIEKKGYISMKRNLHSE